MGPAQALSLNVQAECMPAPIFPTEQVRQLAGSIETIKSRIHPIADIGPTVLDGAASDAARHSLDQGGLTPHGGPCCKGIVKLLNDSLATELVCVLRY